MNTAELALYFVIGLALIFDFVNGFHDAANSIATVVATRVLTPVQAVAWAAFWKLDKIWKAKHICPILKGKISSASVFSVLLYGCEAWIV